MCNHNEVISTPMHLGEEETHCRPTPPPLTNLGNADPMDFDPSFHSSSEDLPDEGKEDHESFMIRSLAAFSRDKYRQHAHANPFNEREWPDVYVENERQLL